MDLAYRVWSILQAVEWRWSIREILDQPEALLDDVMLVEFANRRVREQGQEK